MKPFHEWDKGVLVVGFGTGLLLAVISGLGLWLLSGKASSKPGPDSPIVVSGGSLNFFANNATVGGNPGWQVQPGTPSNLFNLYSENVGGPPSVIDLDGVDVLDVNGNKVAGDVPLSLPNNWIITLNMRLNKGVSDAKDVSDDGSINYVYICTELNKAATGCNMKPSGPLLNNNPIYVDDNQTNALKVTDFDRTYARLHFSDPQCFLGLDATGKPVADADKQCDHIQSIDVLEGPATRGGPNKPYHSACFDGACRIWIDHP